MYVDSAINIEVVFSSFNVNLITILYTTFKEIKCYLSSVHVGGKYTSFHAQSRQNYRTFREMFVKGSRLLSIWIPFIFFFEFILYNQRSGQVSASLNI